MKRLLIALILVVACSGCASMTGRDVGNIVGAMGAVAGAVIGFDPFSGASTAIGAGGVLVGAAVEDAIENNHKPDEEKDVYSR